MGGGLRRQRKDRHRPVVRDLRKGPLQFEPLETARRPAVGDQDEDRLLTEPGRRPRPAVDHGQGIGAMKFLQAGSPASMEYRTYRSPCGSTHCARAELAAPKWTSRSRPWTVPVSLM